MNRHDTDNILRELDDYLARAEEPKESDASQLSAGRRIAPRLERPFPDTNAGIPMSEIDADRNRIDAAYERFLIRYAEWMKAFG